MLTIKKLKKSIIIGLSFVLLFSFALPSANASELSVKPKNEIEKTMIDQLNKLKLITDKKLKSKWEKAAYKQIKIEKVKIYSTELDFNQAKVYTHKNNDYTTVVIPVSSSKHHEVSSVALHFLNRGTVDAYSELLIKESDKGTFQTISYINGEETFNEITNEPFITAKEYAEKKEGKVSAFGLDMSGFIQCLGLPSIVGWQLGNVCAIACYTAVACVPCLAVALGLGVGAVGTCAYENWD